MKIIILGGFLGSGKTTLLMQLVPFLVGSAYSGKDYPVVVLENEISTTDVDSKMLRSRGMEVRTLAAGCICCTSTASLCESMKEIRKNYDPDYVVIEATGMAYPDSVRQILLNAGEENIDIVAMADAKRWDKVLLAMPQFVKSQLHQAKLIFLNKIDLVSAEQLDRIQREIENLIPAGRIVPVVAKDGISEEILSELIT